MQEEETVSDRPSKDVAHRKLFLTQFFIYVVRLGLRCLFGCWVR